MAAFLATLGKAAAKKAGQYGAARLKRKTGIDVSSGGGGGDPTAGSDPVAEAARAAARPKKRAKQRD